MPFDAIPVADARHTYERFVLWAGRANPGAEFRYFVHPHGRPWPNENGSQETARLFAYAWGLYAAGKAALFQRREKRGTLYIVRAVSVPALKWLDAAGKRDHRNAMTWRRLPHSPKWKGREE